MTMSKLSGFVLLPLFLLTTGCGDSATVELHEPGEYSGKTDPLLKVTATPAHEQQLRDRLMQVQTDR